MIKICYSFLICCFIFTIISCGKTTEENVNDTVSKTNDTIFGTGGGSGGQCQSGGTFQKNIYARQVKQTNDCGYIVASSGGYLKKLDEFGETKWETKITLYQAEHSNLGKSSVIQTSDGGYLYSDEMELRNLVLLVKLNGKTENIVTLQMPFNTVMDTITLLVKPWSIKLQKERFISLILKGKKYG